MHADALLIAMHLDPNIIFRLLSVKLTYFFFDYDQDLKNITTFIYYVR